MRRVQRGEASRRETRPASSKRVELERGQRLSRSVLWQLQRAFFEQRGLTAWSKEVVPHYITNNPRIASAYAHVVREFIRYTSTDKRLYIVELGVGSGRFGYRFLNTLHALLEDHPAPFDSFTYVMTDISERTLQALQSHPYLQPFIRNGSLDFARFDAEQPEPLCLRIGGKTPDTRGPTVVFANYVFDSLPQDCFAIRDHELHECLVTTRATAPVSDPFDPGLLERVRLSFVDRPIEAETYYPIEAHNAVLDSYRGNPDGVFLFPTAAFATLDYFKSLGSSDLLILSADKGFHRIEEIRGLAHPRLTLHGSFSFAVNYHGLGEYARAREALVLEPQHSPTGLRIVAYVWGAPAAPIRVAYQEFIENGGPDDFYAVKKALEPFYSRLDLSQLLGFVRFSGFDSDILLACAPTIHKVVANASTLERADLIDVLERVWNTYLPLAGGDGADLAFEIGTLLFKLDEADRALVYFQRSREWWGLDAATAYNAALCLKRLGDRDAALRSVEEALQLQPEFELASILRYELLGVTAPR